MGNGINPGPDWLALFGATERAQIAPRLGLTYPIDPNHEDVAPWLALIDLGVCLASVVREPEYRVDRERAARDAGLDRSTIWLAPQWRYPLPGEAGMPALIVPVDRDGEALSLSQFDPMEGLADHVADLIALPFEYPRALSMTGHTAAVGRFAADDQNRLVLFGSGNAWLTAHLNRARVTAAHTPPHLVSRLHVPFDPPTGSLVIEPRAFEWRPTRLDCAIPAEAREVRCPDSRALAEQIDAAMRKKDKPRPMPTVLGPPARRAGRAA